jgi:hypothetical protein
MHVIGPQKVMADAPAIMSIIRFRLPALMWRLAKLINNRARETAQGSDRNFVRAGPSDWLTLY